MSLYTRSRSPMIETYVERGRKRREEEEEEKKTHPMRSDADVETN